MSAIAGILRFDGCAVARRDLGRMASALRSHGPDRTDTTCTHNVGLAHVLMRMTPEDQFDSQPFRGSSGAIIAADLRLDNRDDIRAQLGIAPADASVLSDARLVMSAWEKFGDDVWPRLHGPFAVAIWDSRNRILTLARDHLGLNVVMWHKSARFFAFATMPKGLFALSEVPRELSQDKFADFLVLNHADHVTTFYRSIFRIPPAHFAKITSDGAMVHRCYWSPTDVRPIRLHSDQAYAEALRECLDRSVRRQMRSIHLVGSHLTGGLDSSSVSVLAARALREKNQRLASFTQVPRLGFDGRVADGCYGDETPHVEAIRNLAGNIDVTYVHNDTCDDFAELERFFVALEGPVRNPTTLGGILAILRKARDRGRRVILGGFFGNSTISWNGWSQVAKHVRSGKWITAFRQCRSFYRCSSHSRWSAFHKLIIDPLLPESTTRRAAKSQNTAPWLDHAAIRCDFAAAAGVQRRATRAGHDFLYRLHLDERARSLTPVDYFGDWLAAEKALTGVETRDPTADMSVIAFCFGIPPEQYLVEDIDRSLIRRAMWGLLPQEVLTSRLVGAHAADWYEKLSRRRSTFAEELVELARSPLARKAIDFDRLERAIENWPVDDWHTPQVANEYHFAMTRGLAAARFLRWVETANR